jgi:hypothetical protein
MFDLWFGGKPVMPQDEWFLISVPLVIFLVVMIAASLTLPQP